jgi:hypothetical protein
MRALTFLLALAAAGATLGVAACSSEPAETIPATTDAPTDASVGADRADARVEPDGGRAGEPDGSTSDADAGPLRPFVTDGGFVQTPPLPGVQCRAYGDGGITQFTCATGQVCCEQPFGTSKCVLATESCSPFRLACDGPEDCAIGQVCRYVGTTSACAVGPGAGDGCHSKADCTPGSVCCQPKSKLSDGGDLPPPSPGSNLAPWVNGGCLPPGSPNHWCDG